MGGVAFLTQDGTPSRYCNITSPPDTLPPPAICLEIKNMTKQKTNKVLQEKWWKKFKQTRLYKEGGSCFECCDYEGMVDDMESFIRQEIRQAKIETFEIVKMIIYESVQKNLTKNWVDGEVNRRLSNLKKQ